MSFLVRRVVRPVAANQVVGIIGLARVCARNPYADQTRLSFSQQDRRKPPPSSGEQLSFKDLDLNRHDELQIISSDSSTSQPDLVSAGAGQGSLAVLPRAPRVNDESLSEIEVTRPEPPANFPINRLAMMARGVTDQGNGSVYLTITEPGACAFPDIFEHGDRVYGHKIGPDEKIETDSLVAYVLRDNGNESALLIGKVIAGPGCYVKIKDGKVTVKQESEEFPSNYLVHEKAKPWEGWIHSRDERYFIITEDRDSQRFFVDLDTISPFFVNRGLLRYRLDRVEALRYQGGPRLDDIRSSVRQSEQQGKWSLRWVQYQGKLHCVVAIGPSEKIDKDGVHLPEGHIIIAPVERGGADKIVPAKEIEARVMVYYREL